MKGPVGFGALAHLIYPAGIVVILETKGFPQAYLTTEGLSVPAGVMLIHFFTYPDFFFSFLFLKSLNTLDLKTKKKKSENSELLFRAAKAFSVSIYFLKFMNIW